MHKINPSNKKINFNYKKMHKKIILITGASSGIGKFLAIELAKKKYEIILSSRSETRLQETANEIDSLKTPCHIIPADLSDVKSISELYEEIS